MKKLTKILLFCFAQLSNAQSLENAPQEFKSVAGIARWIAADKQTENFDTYGPKLDKNLQEKFGPGESTLAFASLMVANLMAAVVMQSISNAASLEEAKNRALDFLKGVWEGKTVAPQGIAGLNAYLEFPQQYLSLVKPLSRDQQPVYQPASTNPDITQPIDVRPD